MKNRLRCIVIDDENVSLENFEMIANQFCPEIEIIGTASNLETGVTIIKTLNPDVVFLDIEMPRYAGYEIVDFFTEINFKIVFITAYNKYAVKAFEIAAFDYLLKPIDINRLKTVVARLSEGALLSSQIEKLKSLQENMASNQRASVEVSKSGYKKQINLDEIIAVEGQSSYCKIYCLEGEEYMRSENLKQFEISINDNAFFRCHKSWLVNKDHIDSYSLSQLELNLTNGLTIPISRYRKKEFLDFVSNTID